MLVAKEGYCIPQFDSELCHSSPESPKLPRLPLIRPHDTIEVLARTFLAAQDRQRARSRNGHASRATSWSQAGSLDDASEPPATEFERLCYLRHRMNW